MKSKPIIIVQLVHIQGPLKGEIQEFSSPEILIGRHPSCQVRFPKDLSTISRKHAKIIREGNRFKLIDQSTNGTFLNGKRVKEDYLKDGDVLIFAENGPKASFLTKIAEYKEIIEQFPSPKPIEEPKTPEPQIPELEIPKTPKPQMDSVRPAPGRSDEILIKKTQVPLVIQYGPTLRAFKELPVILGKSSDCDFTLDHPAIYDHHAQFFFSQDQYWVKDLTGKKLVSINEQPIGIQAALTPDNRLALSPQGPEFRFLGGGRLAEIEASIPSEPLLSDHSKKTDYNSEKEYKDKGTPKKSSIFKKLFQR
ncbi:MAG: FHA domain-containing protein [Desulfobacterales bacterium]|nr:FHA domain-containing protein [Desulfobacterales bacterium]